MKIERVGKTAGRWVKYSLIVDDVDIGTVKRTLASGGDRMTPTERRDGWQIHGLITTTQYAAEQELIKRAIRFGKIKETV